MPYSSPLCSCAAKERICESSWEYITIQLPHLLVFVSFFLSHIFCSRSLVLAQSGSRGKTAYWTDNEECLNCRIRAVPVDFVSPISSGDIDFHCLPTDDRALGILAETPFQIELSPDFVEEHTVTLQTSLATVCVPGGRAIRFANSVLPDQIVIPRGADIRLVPGLADPGEGDGPAFPSRNLLVVRVSGTTESPSETFDQLVGAVFGRGTEALGNSMRAQFARCSFSKIDLTTPPNRAAEGVVSIQLKYRLQGRNVLRVMSDAMQEVAGLLEMDSLENNFRHVIFCIARGTTYTGRGTEWLAFASLKGFTSAINSDRCDSLSTLMHVVGHNLGLTRSSIDVVGDLLGDKTGMVSFVFFSRFWMPLP